MKIFRIILSGLIFMMPAFADNSVGPDSSFEWQSAVPIEELIEEDSGTVKFYEQAGAPANDASERDKTKSYYDPNTRQTQMMKNRDPAFQSESQQTMDRLRAIEERLSNREPASDGKSKEKNVWNSMADKTSDAIKAGQESTENLYRTLFSVPDEMSMGDNLREVALIQSSSGYVPKRVDLIRGVKTRLYISGNLDRKVAFVSDPFNIQRSVKGNGVTVIEFIPDEIGIHKFYDPINKMEGWFLVR